MVWITINKSFTEGMEKRNSELSLSKPRCLYCSSHDFWPFVFEHLCLDIFGEHFIRLELGFTCDWATLVIEIGFHGRELAFVGSFNKTAFHKSELIHLRVEQSVNQGISKLFFPEEMKSSLNFRD